MGFFLVKFTPGAVKPTPSFFLDPFQLSHDDTEAEDGTLGGFHVDNEVLAVSVPAPTEKTVQLPGCLKLDRALLLPASLSIRHCSSSDLDGTASPLTGTEAEARYRWRRFGWWCESEVPGISRGKDLACQISFPCPLMAMGRL